jgi:hypothetical protein
MKPKRSLPGKPTDERRFFLSGVDVIPNAVV